MKENLEVNQSITSALYGLYIRVDSRVIKHFIDNEEAKEKSDVCIDFDGDIKKFTLQEFKERLFKGESQDSCEKAIGTYPLTGKFCPECGDRLHETPQGITCESGHEQPQFQLKRTLQAILIADVGVMAKIIKGEKKITLREGHRDYKAGKVVLVTDYDFGKATIAVIKQITRVQWKLLKEATESEIVADGFNSMEDMLTGLRAFYPQIGLKSPITVIEWK